MPTPEEIRVHKVEFVDAVTTQRSGHKLIRAAKALRELCAALPEDERNTVVQWVRSISDLDRFVSGDDKSYYQPVAVVKKGLRRANLEHLQRYTSEESADIEGADDNDEYTFNIWKTEWIYVETFLKQYEIPYRVLS
ncbi:hypothetical protein [Chryseolinea lacunae]|uniref:Uncharacterized protein n=1 Tax=Chryseolinea lacunae TaxID=2801331 RepID=A0ABS1KUH0_9BACT|nr:hypothetical protein [Chryseolinea lacunae]MBL0742985.1 hypothetical protein [Chryseolinea lacunae]